MYHPYEGEQQRVRINDIKENSADKHNHCPCDLFIHGASVTWHQYAFLCPVKLAKRVMSWLFVSSSDLLCKIKKGMCYS